MAEKQQKVVKKIKSVGNTGSALNLGTKKNDECYTSMQDILNELSYWAAKDKFRGKNIICPCDWDIVDGEEIYGITITYKNDGIELTEHINGFPYKIADNVECVTLDFWGKYLSDYGVIQGYQIETKTITDQSEIEELLKHKLTCNFIRTLTQHAIEWGIKSITASGYNPATGKGTKFQEVDYSKYDICITNPPFSLYGEFMECIVGKVDFIVLAPFMNRTNPSVGLYLMLKQAYIGTSGNSNAGYLALTFNNPTTENKYSTKKVACDWIVSYSDAQEERNDNAKDTGISYELYKDEYKYMPNMTMKDGTHPIKVPVDGYPSDYTGWMFASVNILTKINLNEYEWYGTTFAKYFNQISPDSNPFTHRAHMSAMYIDASGKNSFGGIVFRKRRKDN